MNYTKNKLDQLKGFCAMVECGNINDAAKANYTSPTTISKQISSLEEDLGFALFNKIKNKLIINKQGKIYYKEAKKLLLELDKLYGGKIGIRKISGIETIYLKIINRLRFINDILYKFSVKIKRMIVKIKVKYIISFLFLSTISISYFIHKSINNSFERKITSITKNIAISIDFIENQQKNTLVSAGNAFREKIKYHQNPTSDDLKKWAVEFGVSAIEIFKKTGYMKAKMLASSENLQKDQKDWYTKDYSLSKDEEEMSHKEYNAKYEPFRYDDKSPGYAMHSTMVIWYKDINMWLNSQFLYNDIENALKNSAKFDRNIKSISISSPSGKIMFSTDGSQRGMESTPIEDFTSLKTITTNDKNYIISHLPFGQIYNIESFKQRYKSLLNKNGEYFYVLNVTFDKKELNHKIFILNIVTFSILIMLLVSFFALKRKGVRN